MLKGGGGSQGARKGFHPKRCGCQDPPPPLRQLSHSLSLIPVQRERCARLTATGGPSRSAARLPSARARTGRTGDAARPPSAGRTPRPRPPAASRTQPVGPRTRASSPQRKTPASPGRGAAAAAGPAATRPTTRGRPARRTAWVGAQAPEANYSLRERLTTFVTEFSLRGPALTIILCGPPSPGVKAPAENSRLWFLRYPPLGF